jgi:hypothetical protein
VSNREVGIGPVCGMDGSGEPVWALWAPPRLRTGKSSAGWCPRHVVPTALPALADGYARIGSDRALQAVVERAIEHLLSADGEEVLDVRIPIACSGLELLAWGVLRGQGWLTQDTFRRINAAAAVRLLLRWAGISTELPDGFPALAARQTRLNETGLSEMIFNVRNGLIHPPRVLADPAWPTHEELIEAWQLATWCLQLVVLRLLNYDGAYWSRLKLGRSEMAVEDVPWAARPQSEPPPV